MVILFIYERKIIPEDGGVERVTLLLSREFKRRGYNVEFLSVGPHDWNKKDTCTGFHQGYIPLDAEGRLQRIRDYIEEVRPELVILQNYNKFVTSVIPAIPAGIKKMLVYHNQPYSFLGQERFVNKLTPWKSLGTRDMILKGLAIVSPRLYRHLNMRRKRAYIKSIVNGVDKFVLLSESFRPRLIENTPGINSENIIAINNPNTFDIPEETHHEKKENLVVFVGRLNNQQKNVTGFINVWKKFSERFPDWKAVILGDGEDREYIKGYAKKLKVKNLEFAGVRKDVADFYSRGKILCMTSAYEGWGMVLGETIAYGCVPVLYDSFESAGDIVEDGVSGFLIPPYDIDRMVKKLSELASDEKLRKEMAENGKRKIEEFYIERIADRWEQEIEGLVERGNK